MIPELSADIFPLIGAKLPLRDHLNFVAATRKHVSDGGLSPDHYANSVATQDALVGSLLRSKAGSTERKLLQEALFASRSRAELGIDAQYSPATNPARFEARRFFDSLKRSDVFASLAAHAKSDPRLWSMLRAAWTRRPLAVAAQELRSLGPILSSAQTADLAELNSIAQTLKKMSPKQAAALVITTKRMTVDDNGRGYADTKPPEYNLIFARALLAHGELMHAQMVLNLYTPKPAGREEWRVLWKMMKSSDHPRLKRDALWSHLYCIPELTSEPELQTHRFLQVANEVRKNHNSVLGNGEDSRYLEILASLVDRDVQKNALFEMLDHMRTLPHFEQYIGSIENPDLRALAEVWQRSKLGPAE